MTACIFYFDVIGVREAYPSDTTIVTRLQAFQRSVRGIPLPFGSRWSTLITLYDNVWARINAAEATSVEHIALTIATSSMRYAQGNGFNEYFGACTMGDHTFDVPDKTLVEGLEPCDIRIQHIDTLSDPHMRAASLEKCLTRLHRVGQDPIETPCVWIGEEVADYEILQTLAQGHGLHYNLLNTTIDFNELSVDDHHWRFPHHSRFTPISI
jgi:hypothetical protein